MSNIRNIKVEITPETMYRTTGFEQRVRIEVRTEDGRVVTSEHILPRDDFMAYFDRYLMDVRQEVRELMETAK